MVRGGLHHRDQRHRPGQGLGTLKCLTHPGDIRVLDALFRDDPFGTPYNVAEVTLEEGPRLLTNVVGDIEPEVGMAVEIVYTEVTDEVTLAHFRAVEQ